MFLVGNFQHSLDDKNRIRLPSKYREKLKTDDYLLMPGTNGCIFLFAANDEQKMLKAIADYESFDPEQSERVRRLTEFAATVTADSQGRFMLPPDLIAISGIKKDVRIVGSISKVEIWSEERYTARRNSQDCSPEAFNELYRDVHSKMQDDK
ncbi:MAG: hypothetical protein NC183_07070 [Corallococcus sp.]|nr:hypothetical protein [Corallococcus sp.]